MQVAWETRKIFGLSEEDVKISCTAVRIPTLRAHAESISLKTAKPISPSAVREILAEAPGLKIEDSVTANVYPMPLTSSGKVILGNVETSPKSASSLLAPHASRPPRPPACQSQQSTTA